MRPHEMQIECSFVNNEIASEHNNSFNGYIGGMGKDFIIILLPNQQIMFLNIFLKTFLKTLKIMA